MIFLAKCMKGKLENICFYFNVFSLNSKTIYNDFLCEEYDWLSWVVDDDLTGEDVDDDAGVRRALRHNVHRHLGVCGRCTVSRKCEKQQQNILSTVCFIKPYRSPVN